MWGQAWRMDQKAIFYPWKVSTEVDDFVKGGGFMNPNHTKNNVFIPWFSSRTSHFSFQQQVNKHCFLSLNSPSLFYFISPFFLRDRFCFLFLRPHSPQIQGPSHYTRMFGVGWTHQCPGWGHWELLGALVVAWGIKASIQSNPHG